MTKKSYQKRLPTVLSDAGSRSAAPAPRVPAPRVPVVANKVVAPVVEPVDPVAPVEPDQHHPRPSAEQRPPSTGRRVAMVVGALVLVGIAGSLLVPRLLDSAPDRTAGVIDARSPAGSDTSYVVSEVLPNGDIVVSQRIRAGQPIRVLRLEVPSVTGGEGVSATLVDVVADGTTALGPPTITDEIATYIFAPATDVRIRYRLTGAVQLSESAPGRALAVVTSLDVRYAPRVERESRVVRASEVLLLACSSPLEEPPVPCGEPDGVGRWRVDVAGERVDDRVVAQLTLG